MSVDTCNLKKLTDKCISIPINVASVNRFSSGIVRQLLLCISITIDLVSAFALACQLNLVLVENADAC